MKITAIKTQIKRAGRYSIFIDGNYVLSLSDTALLDSRLTVGQELTSVEIRELKKLSDEDKLYGLTLRYAAMRKRSKWEIESYLGRKKASPALTDKILSKLSNNGFIDDEGFARALVNDRRLFKPASRRKIIVELRQKHVPDQIIKEVMAEEAAVNDMAALKEIIETKRRQVRYQDDQKLMQYLARQGFNYGDIKAALQE